MIHDLDWLVSESALLAIGAASIGKSMARVVYFILLAGCGEHLYKLVNIIWPAIKRNLASNIVCRGVIVNLDSFHWIADCPDQRLLGARAALGLHIYKFTRRRSAFHLHDCLIYIWLATL